MGIGSMLSSAGSAVMDTFTDIAGFNEKAIIEITDISERTFNKEEIEQYKTGAMNTGFSSSIASNYISTDMIKDASTSIGKLNQMATDAMDLTEEQQIASFLAASKSRQYVVLFNPNEITLSAHGGGQFPSEIFEDSPRKRTDLRSSSMLPAKARVEFSVRLLFDRTNIKEAFLADKATLSGTGIVKEGINIAKKVMGKKEENSVQKEVEAFIAAIRNPNTRLISFNWGDMCYEGMLSRVNADYTMFNINGQPCRAFVTLRILCVSDRYKQSALIFGQRYDKYWGKDKSANPVDAALNNIF